MDVDLDLDVNWWKLCLSLFECSPFNENQPLYSKLCAKVGLATMDLVTWKPKVGGKWNREKFPKWNANVSNVICFWVVLFFFFCVFLLTDSLGNVSWFCGLPGILSRCSWMLTEMKFYQCESVLVRTGPSGSDRCEYMYERSYVFRFCATKNLNSKKPWKKGKISVFSFGMELLLRELQSEQGGGWLERSSMFKRKNKCKTWWRSMDSSAVDGDETVSVH